MRSIINPEYGTDRREYRIARSTAYKYLIEMDHRGGFHDGKNPYWKL